MKPIDQFLLLKAAKSGQNVICILRDDTDAFVLLAYWVNHRTCNSTYRWSAGMDQYLTSIPSVLILVRNACKYYVCMRSVFVIQLPTLMVKEMSLH